MSPRFAAPIGEEYLLMRFFMVVAFSKAGRAVFWTYIKISTTINACHKHCIVNTLLYLNKERRIQYGSHLKQTDGRIKKSHVEFIDPLFNSAVFMFV